MQNSILTEKKKHKGMKQHIQKLKLQIAIVTGKTAKRLEKKITLTILLESHRKIFSETVMKKTLVKLKRNFGSTAN